MREGNIYETNVALSIPLRGGPGEVPRRKETTVETEVGGYKYTHVSGQI